MLTAKKNELKELFFLFVEESVKEIKKHFKSRDDLPLYEDIHGFTYTTNSSGTTYGDKNRKIINTSVVHSMDAYRHSFNTEKGKNLSTFLLNSELFSREPGKTEEYEYKRIHEGGNINMLVEFLELQNSFTCNKGRINRYIDDFINGLESSELIVHLALVLPNLFFAPVNNRNIKLESGFILKKFSDTLKINITNSFISSVSNLTYGNIAFESIFSSDTILYKEFKIPKDRTVKLYYSYSRKLTGYPNDGVLNEIKNGIEIIKKMKIFFGKNIYISNAFYAEADTQLILKENPEWRTDPHIDFFVPNLVFFEKFFLIKKGLRNFLKKYSVFEHSNFEIQLNRFIAGLEGKRSDRINSMLDFLIFLESILVDASSEISYQFSLFGSLFFAKKSTARKDMLEFFKLLYKLRSVIVHGRSNSEIEKTIKKLKEKDSQWFEKLIQYCHKLLLFLIEKNIKNKEDFINSLKKKIHL